MRTRHDLDPDSARRAEEFIRVNLPLTEVPGTGVRLHLAGPRSGLSRLVPAGGTPYWAHAWPGGAALAAYIARHPQIFERRQVVEIGGGSGLVSIAAARCTGCRAYSLDTDPLAAVATRINAEANGVGARVETVTGPSKPPRDKPLLTWSMLTGRGIPIILVADLFYDEAVAAHLTMTFDVQSPRAIILIGDIGRRFLPRDRLEPLASYPVRDVGDPPSAPLRGGWVFRWKRLS